MHIHGYMNVLRRFETETIYAISEARACMNDLARAQLNLDKSNSDKIPLGFYILAGCWGIAETG